MNLKPMSCQSRNAAHTAGMLQSGPTIYPQHTEHTHTHNRLMALCPGLSR